MSRWAALLPEAALALTAAALFPLMAVRPWPRRGPWARRVLAGGAFLAVAASVMTRGASEEFLWTAYRVDAFSQLAKAAVAAFLLVAALAQEVEAGTALFLAVAALGLAAAAGTAELMALVLAIEIASLSLGISVALAAAAGGTPSQAGRVISAGLTSSAVTILGVVLLAAATQATRLSGLAVEPGQEAAALAGAAILTCGLLLRLGAAPVRCWLPYLYRDAAGAVVAMAGGAAWISIVWVTARLVATLGAVVPDLAVFLALAAAAMIVWGSLNAVLRRDVRCSLSFLLVAQGAFALAGLAPRDQDAVAATLGFVLPAALGQVLAGLALAGLPARGDALTFADLRGLASRAPWRAAGLVIGIAGAVGVWPGTSPAAKWPMLAHLRREGWRWLAATGFASSLLLAAGVAVLLWQLARAAAAAAEAPPVRAAPPAVRAVLVALAAAVLALVASPHALAGWADAAARLLP